MTKALQSILTRIERQTKRSRRVLLALTDDEHDRLAALASRLELPLAVATRALALAALDQVEQEERTAHSLLRKL